MEKLLREKATVYASSKCKQLTMFVSTDSMSTLSPLILLSPSKQNANNVKH